ncbi:hypothetical protein ACIF8T_37325 [Streptomyces sp. NPDC085946]|uniref:ATP-dependent DNA ligase n=1 Tax=Streptomyces sp. NPDC085946 TaxID=3365744 RepID=UPI0037D413F7
MAGEEKPPGTPDRAAGAGMVGCPAGVGWAARLRGVAEPKRDGYRAQFAAHTDRRVLRSGQGTDVTGPFPEIRTAALARLPTNTGLDDELVVLEENRLAFERLQQRLGGRGRGTAEAARQRPAHYAAFGLVHQGDTGLTGWPYERRRAAQEALFADHRLEAPLTLCPSTTDPAVARGWLQGAAAGLEGLCFKRLDEPYRPTCSWLKYEVRVTTEAVIGAVAGCLAAPGRCCGTCPPAAMRCGWFCCGPTCWSRSCAARGTSSLPSARLWRAPTEMLERRLTSVGEKPWQPFSASGSGVVSSTGSKDRRLCSCSGAGMPNGFAGRFWEVDTRPVQGTARHRCGAHRPRRAPRGPRRPVPSGGCRHRDRGGGARPGHREEDTITGRALAVSPFTTRTAGVPPSPSGSRCSRRGG